MPLVSAIASTPDNLSSIGTNKGTVQRRNVMTDTNLNTDDTSGEVSTITARKGHVQALAFAAKGGAALNALLAGIADQKAAERMGSIKAMCFLVSNYSDDEQHAVPVVGSKQGSIEDGGTGNMPYDRYSQSVNTPQGKRMVPGSWFTDVVKSTDEWMRVQSLIAFLDGEEAPEGVTVPDEYASIRKTGEAEAIKQTLRDRVSDMRTGLTKGAMLFHHCEAIGSLNPERIKVRMPWRLEVVIGNDGQPVKIAGTNEFETQRVVYGSKIKLQDPTGEHDDKVYSVSSFLQIKHDVVADMPMAERTIIKLDDTTTRPPKDKGKAGAAAGADEVKVPVTVEQVLLQFNTLASGIDQEQDQGERLYAAILTKASGKDEAAIEARQAIAKICMACDSLWTIIRPMYLIDVERQAAKNIAEQTQAK